MGTLMPQGTRLRRLCVVFLTLALVMGGWPTPALKAVFGATTAYAEEQEAPAVAAEQESAEATDDEIQSAAPDAAAVDDQAAAEESVAGDDEILVAQSTDDELVAQDDAEAIIDYQPLDDRLILPGWSIDIDEDYSGRVEDANHPDGEDFIYDIVDVRVVSETPAEAGEPVFEEEERDWGWGFRAMNLGTAVFEVTHEAYGGGTASYTFEVEVADTEYHFELNKALPEDDQVLPGSTVDVWLQGYRQTATKQTDDENSWYEYETTTDGLGYAWTLEEGGEVAEMVVDANDPTHVTLKISTTLPEGQDNFDNTVLASVALTDLQAAGSPQVARSGWVIDVRDNFSELHPTSVDRHLGIGSTESFKLELRNYAYGQANYTTNADAAFFFWYDTNCVSIKDASGKQLVNNGERDSEHEVSYPAGTYTITRTGDWDTRVNIRASWFEDGEYREYWRMWWLDQLDYDCWFDEQNSDVFVTRNDDGSFSDGGTVTNVIELNDELASLDELTVSYRVGTGDWGDDGFEWEQEFDSTSGLYSTTTVDGKPAIKVDGTKMAQLGIDNLRVEAHAKRGDYELVESHNDWWVHLKERIYDYYDFPGEATMMPGWDWTNWVQESSWVFVYDETHDDEYPLTVTKVTIADTSVATVEKDGDGWTLIARDYGDTTATITYTDYDGVRGCTWTVPVSVSDKVYELETWFEPDACVQPGQSVDVYARGMLQRVDNYTLYGDLDVQWEIPQSNDYSFVIDENDPTHATITFRGLGNQDPGAYFAEARPCAVLFATDDSGNRTEEVRREVHLAAQGRDFVRVLPVNIDRDLDINQSVTVNPEVRHFFYDQQAKKFTSEAVDPSNLQFSWWFDGEAVRMTDRSGAEIQNGWGAGEAGVGAGPYTITRLREWGTDLGLMVRWVEGTEPAWYDGDQTLECEVHYQLAPRFYHVWFDAESYAAAPGDNFVATLDTSRLSGLEDGSYELSVDVGALSYDGNEFGFTEFLPADDFTVQKDAQSWTITIPADKILACDWQDARPCVSAFMTMGEDLPAWGAYADLLLSLKGAKVTLASTSYTYDGTAKKPAVKSVVLGERTLTAGEDYTVSYKNNTNAGTATVTVKGTGAYAGSATATFKINALSLSKASIAKIAEQAYNGGNEVKPAPVVTLGGKTLKSGTDYTVSYSNNKKEGTAKVTVTGKGNYTGSKSASFTIKYKAPSWSGATSMPVKATAGYSVTNGGYIRVKSGGKWAKSDSIVSISGKTVTAKKAGTTTIYLLDSKGKQMKSQKVTVYAIHGKAYEFESSVDKSYVLDIQGGSAKDGAQMIVYKRNGGDNQKYQFYLQSDNTYAIRSKKSGKWLTVESKTNKYVQQMSWKGNGAQKWNLTVDSSNRVTFVNVGTGKCFDVQGGKTKNSAKMIVWESNGGKNQKWKLNQK